MLPLRPSPRLPALLSLLTLLACGDKDPPTDIGCCGGPDSDTASGDDTGDTDTTLTDADADGYDVEADCDDTNAAIHPGADELCDEVDNNCDGNVDEGATTTFYADEDRDGFGNPSTATQACEAPYHHSEKDGDCDDTDAAIYPGAAEVCDEAGADEDCDGLINDDDSSVTGGTIWYPDADADGYGDGSAPLSACTPPSGYTDNDLDCDDDLFDKADPSDGCWTGTWTGTYKFTFELVELSSTDACSGAVSLPVDIDASPMISGKIVCTGTSIGTVDLTVTGDIAPDATISGIIDTGLVKLGWTGDITKGVLSGTAGGIDTSLGLTLKYTFEMNATL